MAYTTRSDQVENGTSGAVRINIDEDAADALVEAGGCSHINVQQTNMMQDESMHAAGQQANVGTMVTVPDPASREDAGEQVEADAEDGNGAEVDQSPTDQAQQDDGGEDGREGAQQEGESDREQEEEGAGQPTTAAPSTATTQSAAPAQPAQAVAPAPAPAQVTAPAPSAAPAPATAPAPVTATAPAVVQGIMGGLVPRNQVDINRGPTTYPAGQPFERAYMQAWMHLHTFYQ